MKASDLLIKCLENEGVEFIFGLPGEENLDLLESIRASELIKFVLCRHEQGAGFMAATYGRLTGKVGVCLSTLGPGATNMVTPTAYAQLGSMPMVIITGQKPVKQGQQGQFQMINVVEMMTPLTKLSKQVDHAEHIPSMIRESFRVAVEPRAGAVHIELPEDIAQEDLVGFEPFEVVASEHPVPSMENLIKAKGLIHAAKHPLLLIGAGAETLETGKALLEFISTTGISFFTTQMGKGVIDERHELCLGTAALSSNDFIHEAIRNSDLIINVGHDIVEKPPFIMSHDDQRKVIHLNYLPAKVDEVYFPQLNVVGDIASAVTSLNELVNAANADWDFSLFMKVRDHVRDRLSSYALDNRFPILPQRLVKLCREVLDDDSIITLDNGMYKIWFARNYPSFNLHGLVLDNALATMGAGLPSAILSKLIYPEKTVVSVNGDGGFMMNVQEVETAVRLGIDLIVIVLNDEGYGMIKWKQEDSGFSNFGLDYHNPDLVKLAESFGVEGHRPTSVADFESIFKQCVGSKGIHLIDLPIDYSLNHEILNVKLKQYTEDLK